MNAEACLTITFPITPGEVVDRLTIQLLRMEHLPNERITEALRDEVRALEDIWETVLRIDDALDPLRNQLLSVNKTLWGVEDQLREHEGRGDFGSNFVELARSVYLLNDERSAIKRAINDLCLVPHTELKTFGSRT